MNLKFFKLQGSGNDFILIDNREKIISPRRYSFLAKKLCPRKIGIGADGLLVIEESKKADFKFLIFNSDGSEATMCGNGARCAGVWAKKELSQNCFVMETKAGEVVLQIKENGLVKVKVNVLPKIEMDSPFEALGREIKINFINTGVPHVVIFVEKVEVVDVDFLGRLIRNHVKFMPYGTNVNFVEVIDDDTIKVRTYERGVEAETYSCGTGSIASALIYSKKYQPSLKKVKVKNRLETLNVYFTWDKKGFPQNVWLEGKAFIVYKGEKEI